MSNRRSLTVQLATPSGTQTFDYSASGDQTFTVPAGVTSIAAKLWGAGGGSAYYNEAGSAGGGGGAVRAKVAVTPGENLTIKIGGAGLGATDWTAPINAMYGGGKSPPMVGDTAPYNVSSMGGGGGGYTAIYRGTTLLALAGGAVMPKIL